MLLKFNIYFLEYKSYLIYSFLLWLMKKNICEAGDYVEISTKDEKFKGCLIPSTNKDIYVLKLDSGYNIGINKNKIKKIIRLKKFSAKKENIGKIVQKKNLRTISILHTGGTLASRVSYETGAVSAKFTAEEILAMFPELKEIANVHSHLVSNMFSEDLRFSHYNLIAKAVQKEVEKGVHGIIITHGTDTMHYTAAALSFILQDLNIPVILVGAQRSSDRGSSDSGLNLLCAANFIVKTNFSGVAICMHESMSDENCLILPGLKTRKLHSSRRDAFKAVNTLPIARVSKQGKVDFISSYEKRSSKKLKLKLINEKLKIGLLKSHPHMYANEIKTYSNFDGLVLEGTGLGHMPINKIDNLTKENEVIYNELSKLSKKIPIVMTTQALFGLVNMNVYSTGRKLLQAGILGNYTDLLAETAFIKLAWLLSNYNKTEVRGLVNKNLRGEINEKLNKEFLE